MTMSFATQLSGSGLSQTIKKLLECNSEPLQRLTSQVEAYTSNHSDKHPESYSQLIDLLIQLVDDQHKEPVLNGFRWQDQDKASLINGHPRIGAPIGSSSSSSSRNSDSLSEESRKEQLKGGEADPETIQKLALLNHLYEQRYPSLRYVTFVNGRSRSEIAKELENLLSPILKSDSIPSDLKVDPETPNRNNLDFKLQVRLIVPFGSQEWKVELDRALGDLFRIARDRAKKM